jgi:hypothetical protein
MNYKLLAFVVGNVALFASCNKCTNDVPYFSYQEKQWLSQNNPGDTIWFKGYKNQITSFTVSRKDTFSYMPVNGKSFKAPCPEMREFTGIFEMMGRFEIPGLVYSPIFSVTITKDRIKSSRQIYWGEFTGEPAFEEPQYVNQLLINGKAYKDVYIEQNDTTISHSPGRNPGYKIYYNATYGLLKFENAENEKWERIP